LLALSAFASPVITLEEVRALFPDYVNHEQQNGFQAPCVDAFGTLTLNVNVNDILGTVTEPIAVAMVCQQVGLPPFQADGPVSFSDPGITLLSLATVPGHPDAFQIEYIVPLGAGVFDIVIENTGWPQGCLTEMLDWAAWDLVSVSNVSASFGQVKALYP
jgi:hypothetical protein